MMARFAFSRLGHRPRSTNATSSLIGLPIANQRYSRLKICAAGKLESRSRRRKEADFGAGNGRNVRSLRRRLRVPGILKKRSWRPPPRASRHSLLHLAQGMEEQVVIHYRLLN